MVCKLDKQTFTCEFEFYWVPFSHSLVPYLSEKLSNLLFEAQTNNQLRSYFQKTFELQPLFQFIQELSAFIYFGKLNQLQQKLVMWPAERIEGWWVEGWISNLMKEYPLGPPAFNRNWSWNAEGRRRKRRRRRATTTTTTTWINDKRN